MTDPELLAYLLDAVGLERDEVEQAASCPGCAITIDDGYPYLDDWRCPEHNPPVYGPRTKPTEMDLMMGRVYSSMMASALTPLRLSVDDGVPVTHHEHGAAVRFTFKAVEDQ